MEQKTVEGDNLVLSKDGKTLIRFKEKPGFEFALPKTITKIEDGAFNNTYIGEPFIYSKKYPWSKPGRLTIPDSVDHITENAFYKARIQTLRVPLKLFLTEHLLHRESEVLRLEVMDG